jgi:hypothetical protein
MWHVSALLTKTEKNIAVTFLHWLLLLKVISNTYAGIWSCNSYFKCT